VAQRPPLVHPYIPNSAPDVRAAMLREIGVSDIDDLFRDIPSALRVQGLLDLPPPILAEADLERHGSALLAENVSCRDRLSFLGGGCYQHYVPAVCDEIAQRAEFLSSYSGDTYSDKGKYQAFFEYQSLMGELLGMEVVSVPTFDGGSASASAVRVACRLNGRQEILVAGTISPQRLAVMRDLCGSRLTIRSVGFDAASGEMDLDDLRSKLSAATGAVYVENPSYLGFIESQGAEISRLAHAAGAQSVVYVDPSSLGVLAPPSAYGADIVCGDAQPLGIHMFYGGGQTGFIACPDEERYVSALPVILFSIAPTRQPGEYGYGWSTMNRTSYAQRGESMEFTGTTQGLWGIVAGVYLALMGPQGMRELGDTIMQRVHYAMQQLAEIPGVRAPVLGATPFKEFVVGFDGTGKTVAEINRALLEHGIFGGHDVGREFPALGQAALYCVTEVHSKADIDRLAEAVKEVVA
jgi:glycine dehydrogenase subunit 1